MSLLDHAIWWHVFPLGAVGAPIRDRSFGEVEHRLPRLEKWLDHAVALGCSGLLLGPVFESTSHGYDTLDHFLIDTRLGDDADFDHLVAEASRRGLAVMLDGVFNHVGIHHELVTNGSGLIRRDASGAPATWEGHGGLANFDHANPAVADYVVDAMTHWLRRGIAGWRLDAAYSVPSEFWATVLSRVREQFPDAVFLGEILHGDYAAMGQVGRMDTVTQYELWKALWSSIKDTNFWELAHALGRHDDFSSRLPMQTFVGNHDVTRIASAVGDDGAALATIALFTLPGVPSVYYGDEQGFRGEKLEGWHADDQLRPALPDSPADLSPMGAWMMRLHQDVIGLRRRNPWVTRGRVAVVDKQNEWITWEVTGEGHTMRVELALQPTHSARVLVDGSPAYEWAPGR